MQKLYTCEEVAERYGVKKQTVWAWIRKKKMGAVKAGKCYKVREGDLKQFEDSRLTIM